MRNLIMCIGKKLGKLFVSKDITIEDEVCGDKLYHEPNDEMEVTLDFQRHNSEGSCGQQDWRLQFHEVEHFDQFVERVTRLQKALHKELGKKA